MEKQKLLGEEKISKLLISYSIPAIIGMIVNALYNIVDRAFIGNLPGVGPLAITGVGITMPITTIFLGFGLLIGVGAAANISIRLGQGKKEDAEKFLGGAMLYAIIISVLITIVILLFSGPILRVFGASDATLPFAKEYIDYLAIGTIFSLTGFILTHIARSDGNPRLAATTMIVGALINVCLDYLLMYVFDFGIRGAAIATVVAQLVVSIWLVLYFVRGKSLLKLKREYLKFDVKYLKLIIAIGMAPFAMQIAASMVQVLANNTLKYYGGDLAIGAFAAISSVALLFLMPIFGINQGLQPIVGYNYGAKLYNRSKQALIYAIMGGSLILISGFIVVMLFPTELISIFNNDRELLDIAEVGIRIYLFTLPILGVSVIGPIYFQSIGRAKISMFLSLLRQVFLLIPLIYLLPNTCNLGLIGVWLSQPIADIITATLVAIFLVREFKREH